VVIDCTPPIGFGPVKFGCPAPTNEFSNGGAPVDWVEQIPGFTYVKKGISGTVPVYLRQD